MKTRTVFLATDIDDNEKVFEMMQDCIDFCMENTEWGWHEVTYYYR